MGMIFIVWDKVFGTFEKEEELVVFGLTENLKTYNPMTLVFHEWRAIFEDLKKQTSIKNKIMYVFGPPGWSHDGSRKTSKQLRDELKSN